MAEQERHTENLTVVYDSQDNTADAEAVAETVLAVKAILEQIQDGLEENEQILLRARPFGEGSLEVPLELIVFGGAILLSEYPLFEQVRRVLAEIFKIKMALKGQPITVEDGNVVIINDSRINVDQITLQCIDPSSEVSKNIASAFEAITRDESVASVRFKSENLAETIIEVHREDFEYMRANSESEEEAVNVKVEQSREHVTIRQPAFDSELAWRFVWRGEKIAAKLHDELFNTRVSSGAEKFVAGDGLEVELVRRQEYDPKVKSYITRQYEVIKVYDHYQRSQQHGLFEE